MKVNIVELIKKELLKRCNESKDSDGFDFYEDHIKYVVENAVALAKKYDADVEIVELGALLHDIAMPSNIGPREEQHIYGAKIAEELLIKYNYPQDKIEAVKQCVLNHRGIKDLPRNTIEEEIVADADVIAHFDSIPALFSLAFKERNLNLNEGTKFVKKKLERDYNKLSVRTKKLLEERYFSIRKVLFNE
ncbi:MAG: HD domain-containing protein [Bacilli bacterium]|nr:HD domain-containing protein [Bacilli bacterium]